MSEYKVSFVKGSLLNNNNCIKHGSDAVMIDENDRGIYIGNNTNNPKMVATGPNSFKTINGESILGSGDISTDNSYFLDFDISDIANLLKTDEAFEYDGASLVEAIRNNKNIYIYYDKTTRSMGMALVNCHYEDYMDMTFCYDGELYSIQAEGINFITKREVVVKTIHSIPTMDDIFDEGLDGDYVKANGIVDENDYYYHVPSDTVTNPDFTLATKSDINASLTKPANYQIWYTTTDDSVIEFDDTLFDNNQLVSNVYENGKGVITFDRDILSIPTMVFNRKNKLKTIIIPDSVTTIKNSAFLNCTSLTSVTIGDSVRIIEIQAFINCNSLTSITIPDSVIDIGDKAFYNCTSLTSVTIPERIVAIGTNAFYSCTSLTSVYCKSTIPPGIYEDTTPFDTNTNLKIYVPIESLETYKNAEGWNEYSDKICSLLDSNSVKTINGESIVGSGDITIDTSNLATKDELAQKQDTLVSGTNIKTINGTTILGSGNIAISATTPMRYSAPAANIVIQMGVKVITSVTSTNQTFTLYTNRLVTDPASITQEQKFEIVFAISGSLSTAPTITFNTGSVGTIYWINGEAPTFEVGKFYEVSFLNAGGILLGVCAEFSAS